MAFNIECIAGEEIPWWDTAWRTCLPVNLTETIGIDRADEPVDIFLSFDEGTCRDPEREVRVLSFNGSDWSEVPSQVYNASYNGINATSCNVVFMANCPADNNTTYYIYYNNKNATRPVYDGLRLYEELEGDTYTVNVTAGNEEKRYFRIFWKKNVDLYCDGVELAQPGGAAGWEFSQMIFSSLWEDDKGNHWFSSNINAALEVLNEGPLFIDLIIRQPMATDLWGGVFNSNVSTSYSIRVYYQPDLNPLLRFQTRFTYEEDAITESPWFLTLKLANGTSTQVDSTYIEGSYEAYEHTTFKNTDGIVSKVPAENPTGGVIWNELNPTGWWSFNGSRPESNGKPAANIGLIPIDSSGTNETYNYTVHFNSQLEENDNEAWFFLGNITGGLKEETIETTSFIHTYPLEEDAEPEMTTATKKLYNPLEVNSGIAITRLLFGDLNDDGIVDMRDIGVIAIAFGSYPSHPRWNPQYDFNEDLEIDLTDLLIIAKNFGTH